MKLFSYKRLLVFFLSVIALIGSIGFTLVQVHRLQNSSKWVSHTYEVINLLETIVLNVSETESLGLGYLLTNDSFFLERYNSTNELLNDDLNKILYLISDNPTQLQNIESLKGLISQKMTIINKAIVLKRQDNLPSSELILKFNFGRLYLERIKVIKDKMVNEEQHFLSKKQEMFAMNIIHTVYAVIASFVVVFFLGLFQLFFVIRYIKSQKKLESDLVQLNDNKNRFFSIISHDLRGPINNILQLSELVKEEGREEEKSKLNEMIEVSVKKVYDLLNNLLEWSRAQMNVIKVLPQIIYPQKLVKENFLLLDEMAKAKGISLINAVRSTETIWADEDMIKTVLRNLVSNSIKFTKTGGVVTVSSEKKGELTEVAVKDNGIGMSRDIMNKLFRTDVKVSELGTSKEFGSGLGLQICKEFVEKNGGKISVESEINKGTIFRFALLSKQPWDNKVKNREALPRKHFKINLFKKRTGSKK